MQIGEVATTHANDLTFFEDHDRSMTTELGGGMDIEDTPTYEPEAMAPRTSPDQNRPMGLDEFGGAYDDSVSFDPQEERPSADSDDDASMFYDTERPMNSDIRVFHGADFGFGQADDSSE